MSDSLVTYLEDHKAGARAAIGLLKKMKAGTNDESLSQFAGSILAGVEEDEETLQNLAQNIEEILETDEITTTPNSLQCRAKETTALCSDQSLGLDQTRRMHGVPELDHSHIAGTRDWLDVLRSSGPRPPCVGDQLSGLYAVT
jgi:hypothetical protein